jgi:serine phosphatase RsbU (regulator of sigma subunit)/HD-like signal output (HDOD) protein
MEHTTRYFIADLVEEVGSLPAVASQVVTLTSDPECDLGELARVIMSDSVMSMRFLALANSAALAGGQEVRELRRALVQMGLRRVRNVALCMGMHDVVPAIGGGGPLQMTELWKHTLATASCAEGLAWLQGSDSQEDAWLTGILHGIGIGALAQKLGDDFQSVVADAARARIPLVEAELSALDFHHGEVGGRILGDWNLPPVFVEAVEYHPEAFESHEISEEAAVLVGHLRGAIDLVRAIGFGHNGDGTPPRPLPELVESMELPGELVDALATKVDRDVAWMSRSLGLDLPEHTFAELLERSRRQVVRLGLEGIDESLARETLEHEMAMARRIQQHLLPREVPDLPGCTLAAENRPSQHISGDSYDLIPLRDGATGLVVADVSGKGMSAALLASNLQATLRALAGVMDDPGDLLATANQALFASTTPERFATVFLAALAPDGRRLRYASAGHNPPLLLRADGRTQWLAADGAPVGMVPEMAYPVSEVALAPGDLLVIYTDGVNEATDPADAEFGEEGLETAVRACAGEPPRQVIASVFAAVARHVAPPPAASRAAAQLLPGAPGGGAASDRGEGGRDPGFADDLTLLVVAVD